VAALCLTLAFCFSPLTSNETLPDPQSQILQALKNKPLTVGQALDVTDVILEQSMASDVPIPLILAVIDTESEFKMWATSRTNAKGLMQLSPEVWRIYMGATDLKDHRNAYDPTLNIRIGTQYLGDLYQIYGDWPAVLRHYFTGSNTRTKATEKYIKAVLSRMERYNRG
jgi:soluble lytic murein transglycosylase-like protein